jgi:hypothetical protein
MGSTASAWINCGSVPCWSVTSLRLNTVIAAKSGTPRRKSARSGYARNGVTRSPRYTLLSSTARAEPAKGRGRSSTAFVALNTAVVDAIPSAIVVTIASEARGLRRLRRNA